MPLARLLIGKGSQRRVLLITEFGLLSTVCHLHFCIYTVEVHWSSRCSLRLWLCHRQYGCFRYRKPWGGCFSWWV